MGFQRLTSDTLPPRKHLYHPQLAVKSLFRIVARQIRKLSPDAGINEMRFLRTTTRRENKIGDAQASPKDSLSRPSREIKPSYAIKRSLVAAGTCVSYLLHAGNVNNVDFLY